MDGYAGNQALGAISVDVNVLIEHVVFGRAPPRIQGGYMVGGG